MAPGLAVLCVRGRSGSCCSRGILSCGPRIYVCVPRGVFGNAISVLQLVFLGVSEAIAAGPAFPVVEVGRPGVGGVYFHSRVASRTSKPSASGGPTGGDPWRRCNSSLRNVCLSCLGPDLIGAKFIHGRDPYGSAAQVASNSLGNSCGCCRSPSNDW